MDMYPIFIPSEHLPKVRLSRPEIRFAFAATDRTWDFHERSLEGDTPRCLYEETLGNGTELML